MLGLREKAKSVVRFARRHPWLAAARPSGINVFNHIFIEPCFNICNLECPYCPVGQRLKLRGMQQGMMSLDRFKRIWKKSFTNYRGHVGLYNWGEPFLNPELPAMVRYARTHSAARLVLNSNFSFQCDDRILEILECLGRDFIIISCDGFSQATCEKYRVNVDFELVMHNIELINRKKKRRTYLLWQYLKFPWNLGDLDLARQYCKRNRIEFYPGEGGLSSDYPMLPTPSVDRSDQSRCKFLFDSLTVNFDGEIYPCCAYYGPPQYSLGNAATTSIDEVFAHGRGKELLDYLTLQSSGDDGLFCKHCVERNTSVLDSWR